MITREVFVTQQGSLTQAWGHIFKVTHAISLQSIEIRVVLIRQVLSFSIIMSWIFWTWSENIRNDPSDPLCISSTTKNFRASLFNENSTHLCYRHVRNDSSEPPCNACLCYFSYRHNMQVSGTAQCRQSLATNNSPKPATNRWARVVAGNGLSGHSIWVVDSQNYS